MINELKKHMEIIDAEGIDGKSFTVLVNPNSYSVQHKSCYANQQPIGSNQGQLEFNKILPSHLKIELLFDSTGSLGVTSLTPLEGVMQQIQAFLEMVYVFDDDKKTNQPRRLKLVWGPLTFQGVAVSIDIAYSHFDAFGNPIRAKATCQFKEDQQARERVAVGTSGDRLNRISFNKEKHLVNGLLKYGSYLQVLQKQPYEQLPNSLRGATLGITLDLITNS